MTARTRRNVKLTVVAVVGVAAGAGAVAIVQSRTSAGHAAVATHPATVTHAADTSTTTSTAALPPATGSVHVPILMYHRISDPRFSRSSIERSLTVSPRVFAQQLNWLQGHHYMTITQTQLAHAMAGTEELPAHPVMITFDDGYVDISNTVMPLMRKRRMKGTAYVITDRVRGHDRAFMKVPALRRIEAGGIEVGSHSASHVDLTQQSDAGLRHELGGSRHLLEKWLGHPVPWLCYPAGRYNAHVEAMAEQAGYVLATTTEPGSVHDRTLPLALSRVRISDTIGVTGLAAVLG